MDPRYRFALVMSCLLITWWVYVVVSTFLIGPVGLNWLHYQQGVAVIGGAVLAGFFTVWLSTKLIAWQRQRKTGFEAEPSDEFGTAYEMMNNAGVGEPFNMALSKFQPALIGTPAANAQLHPLEAELLGFLHGFRHWPTDPAKPEITLYEQATVRWQLMRHIPHAGPWHRVVALAKDLAIVNALEERRAPPKWYQFGARDKISFKRRSVVNPGMSALILSTLPAFRALQQQPEGPGIQRAMLSALRYAHVPQEMPLNAGALASSLVETLARADAQLGFVDISELDQLTPARRDTLLATLRETWAGLLDTFTPSAELNAEAKLYRSGGTPPQHWLHLGALLVALGPKLNAELRTTLKLWDIPQGDPRQHPSWPQLHPLLQELNLIEESAYGVGADVGTFMLAAGSAAWGPCVLINPEASPALAIKGKWHPLPQGPSAELALDPVSLKARAELQLAGLETRLREAF
jgi:hypothetical protein